MFKKVGIKRGYECMQLLVLCGKTILSTAERGHKVILLRGPRCTGPTLGAIIPESQESQKVQRFQDGRWFRNSCLHDGKPHVAGATAYTQPGYGSYSQSGHFGSPWI